MNYAIGPAQYETWEIEINLELTELTLCEHVGSSCDLKQKMEVPHFLRPPAEHKAVGNEGEQRTVRLDL